MTKLNLFFLSVTSGIAALLLGFNNGLAAPPVNQWKLVIENEIDPRFGPALVYSDKLQRFVLLGGTVSHAFQGERGYDVQTLDPAVLGNDAAAVHWQNELPAAGQGWGSATGVVHAPGFASPYFAMTDQSGVTRPNPRHMVLHYQYALAPWNHSVYMLSAGHLLRYDLAAQAWEELTPDRSPAPAAASYKETLNWGAMCADPVNRELVLFGGCGVPTESGGPGTWVYSTEQNTWRKLELPVEPPPRALAPLVYDPATRQIVLFGGDQLDTLLADTWLYDTKTRSWKQQQPELSPAPRFGHTWHALPGSGKLVLVGGNTYTSSTSYQARLYAPLPMELWTYDVAEDRWQLIKHFDEDDPVPAQVSHSSNVAAVDASDRLVWFGPGKQRDEASTWTCQLDASQGDEAGTRTHGVPRGAVTQRTGSYDPAWYGQDVPAADPAAVAAELAKLPANRWTQLEPPKWPVNRQGGGWSTVAYDSHRQLLLHLGGGHSSYFGNDVAAYDTRANRWSVSYRPQFALHYNYDLSGPGPWAFNGGPWGNHNYHAYQYDPVRQRLVYIRNEYTHFYDPSARRWQSEERLADNPFFGSKYTSYVCATPRGVVVWALSKPGSSTSGIWRLTADGWQSLPLSGDPLPQPITDGSTISYDSQRDQLLLTTTRGTPGAEHSGQVWSVGVESGAVKALHPAGADKIVGKRFARESVCLPERNQVLFGFLLGESNQLPIYDVAKNRWGTAEIPGSEFIGRGGTGSSVDLGLSYDAQRQLVWAVMCKMSGPGDLQVLRVDELLKVSWLE